MRRLASIRRFLTSTATATLVSAFALSRIDYCNSLLFGSTHDVTSHLQRIQNYAARVILRLPMSSSITIHLKSLHWLPVKVRSTYKIACLCTRQSQFMSLGGQLVLQIGRFHGLLQVTNVGGEIQLRDVHR